MTTTSLEMSRKLDAAGFFERYDTYISELYDGEDERINCATLDDLVTALGLDKPWSDVHCKCPSPLNSAWCIYEALEDYDIAPDVLAQVWLDTKATRPTGDTNTESEANRPASSSTCTDIPTDIGTTERGDKCPTCNGSGLFNGRLCRDNCPTCNGDGSVDEGTPYDPPWGVKCPTCNGTGHIYLAAENTDTCPACNGTGSLAEGTDIQMGCAKCDGTGKDNDD